MICMAVSRLAIVASLAFVFVACGQEGPAGPAGMNGTNADGTVAGTAPGTNGAAGANGTPGPSGPAGPAGVAGAAGADAVNPSTEVSGARIKARYTTYTATGADGAKQTSKGFSGWFDSQRNEACSVTLSSDGASRCLPTTGTAVAGYCSDAACTKPAVAVVAGAGAPKYLRTPVPVAGGSGTRLSAPGAKLVLATWYYNFGPGNCVSVGAPGATNDVYDASGPEIAPSDFVAFTVTNQTM